MLSTMHILFLAACACLASASPGGHTASTSDQWTTTTRANPSSSTFSTSPRNTTLPSTSRSEYLTRARQSIDHLQSSFYNETTGLYNNLWWNSANALTTLADLAALDPTLQPLAEQTYSKTFLLAQEFNMRRTLPPTTTDGFLNSFYDDEGWWAWAWLKAYDQTHHPPYLSAAISIFNDQTNGFHATCGGLLWSKTSPYDGAIANELFLFVSASLATRVPPAEKQTYLNWALREWDWFQASGLIDEKNLINDGLNGTTCKNNHATTWTYNQGVILAGLVELHKATTNTITTTTTSPSHNATSPYLTKALTLAHGTLASTLTTAQDILREQCDPGCTGDAQQFKGPFMRGLQMLQEAAPQEAFKAFIERNAEAVWSSRGPEGDLSSSWVGGGWDGVKSVQAQSAGGDALVAAAAVGGCA